MSEFRNYIERVRAASPIDVVIGELLKQPPATMIPCPFHSERTGSCHIVPESGFFHCFGCHTGGDVFRFVELREKRTFREALDWLADRAQIARQAPARADAKAVLDARSCQEVVDWVCRYYQSKLAMGPRSYLTRTRGLPEDMIDKYRLGWSDGEAALHLARQHGAEAVGYMVSAGLARAVRDSIPGGRTHEDIITHRLVFPAIIEGMAVFLSGRAVLPNDEPKYLHQRGQSAPIFNLDALVPEGTFVTEGPLDALSLTAWGYPAVGLQGGMRASAVQPLRRRAKSLYAAFDGDRAGVRAAMGLATALIGGATDLEMVKVVRLPAGTDPNDIYVAGRREEFAQWVTAAVDPITFFLAATVIEDRLDLAEVLEPLFRLLAVINPLTAEVWLTTRIRGQLDLSIEEVKECRDIIRRYRTESRLQCPACGTVIGVS